MPRFKQNATFEGPVTFDGVVNGLFVAKNWPFFSDLGSGYGQCVFYDPTFHHWLTFGNDGTNTNLQYSQDGKLWTVPFFNGLSNFVVNSPYACAANPTTGRLVLGGNPAGSSAVKLRTSTDGGQFWNNVNAGAADSEAISTVAYSSATGFIAGGSSSGHTYQSSSGTGTFASGTTLTGNILHMFAYPSLAFAVLSGSSNYYTTTNGTSWTLRTFPASIQVNKVTYNARLNKYFASASSDGIWMSANGTSGWTQVYSLGPVIEHVTSFGNVLVAVMDGSQTTGIIVSMDGVSWDPVASSVFGVKCITTAIRQGAANPHQLMWTTVSPSGQHHASLVG